MATKKNSVGRPVRSDKDNKTASSIEKGTKPGEKRKTYIVNTELADKIEGIAWWERENIKEIVQQAFTDYITKYEKKHGAVKPMKTK